MDETYTVPHCGYLGFIPVRGPPSDPLSISTAIGLLQIKLLKTHEKTLDRLLIKTFKKRFAEDTPEHDYVIAHMKENGVDYLHGDDISCTVSAETFDIVAQNSEVPKTRFELNQVLDHYVLPSKLDPSLSIFALVVRPSPRKKAVVHAIQLSHRQAETLNTWTATLVQQLDDGDQEGSACEEVEDEKNENGGIVTVGIGLTRQSDLMIDAALARSGSYKLKGKRTRSIRRDKKFGSTFQSFKQGARAGGRVSKRTAADIKDPSELDESPLNRKGTWDEMDLNLFSTGAPTDSDSGRPKRSPLCDETSVGPSVDSPGLEDELDRNISEMKIKAISTDNLLCDDGEAGGGGSGSDGDQDGGDEDDIEVEVYGFDNVSDSSDESGAAPPPVPLRLSHCEDEPAPKPNRAVESASEPVYEEPAAFYENVRSSQKRLSADGPGSMPYYHGAISMKRAEAILGAADVCQGAFLVRDSSKPGDMTLSFRNGKQVMHVRIVSRSGLVGASHLMYTLQVCADMKFIDKHGNRGGPWFNSVSLVCEGFRKRPIPQIKRVSRDPKLHGRPVFLTRAVVKPAKSPRTSRPTSPDPATRQRAQSIDPLSNVQRQRAQSIDPLSNNRKSVQTRAANGRSFSIGHDYRSAAPRPGTIYSEPDPVDEGEEQGVKQSPAGVLYEIVTEEAQSTVYGVPPTPTSPASPMSPTTPSQPVQEIGNTDEDGGLYDTATLPDKDTVLHPSFPREGEYSTPQTIMAASVAENEDLEDDPEFV